MHLVTYLDSYFRLDWSRKKCCSELNCYMMTFYWQMPKHNQLEQCQRAQIMIDTFKILAKHLRYSVQLPVQIFNIIIFTIFGSLPHYKMHMLTTKRCLQILLWILYSQPTSANNIKK